MKPLQIAKPLAACALLLFSVTAVWGVDSTSAPSGKIRILLVHGGHNFETNQFFQVFKDNPEIAFTAVEQPKAQTWFKADRAREYDVLVFYDMWQTISEETKSDLVALLKNGKPLVALHHSLCSYQQWDEYANIIGGRYFLQKWLDQGIEEPPSTYKHDVDFTVHVADPNHPVTRGLKDFAIHDETYGGFQVQPESHVLLTTNESTSGRNIAWTKTYGAARVVYIELGHDHQAYENANYRQLIAQALQWAANRSPHGRL